MCTCVCACACVYGGGYVHMIADANKGQGLWIPQELEFQAAGSCPKWLQYSLLTAEPSLQKYSPLTKQSYLKSIKLEFCVMMGYVRERIVRGRRDSEENKETREQEGKNA